MPKNAMNESRYYSYVGPENILRRPSSAEGPPRVRVDKARDVIDWFMSRKRSLTKSERVVVTFVVDVDGALWISDRETEHVLCAGGGDVRAAGEITFSSAGDDIEAVGITNQSTGYCPEPDSWTEVEVALEKASISHPGFYTEVFLFRRCPSCRQINIIKDRIFECDVCGAGLSRE